METIVKLCWVLLALIHASPAAVLFAPGLIHRLYGVDPAGDVGALLVHRGALFLAMVTLCGYALIAPEARRAASLAVSISVIGFLCVFARAGMPSALRMIAIADLIALAPLAVVVFAAWRAIPTR